MSEHKYSAGSSVDLEGEAKEDFEKALEQLVNSRVDAAEDYLEETVRPRIAENWKYYQGELPAKDAQTGMSFVDNTCQATVDHYVAHAIDAFTHSDTVEVIPTGNSNLVVNKVINTVINDVLDSENDRYRLYQSFFKDAFVSSASVFKPYVKEETRIDKVYFSNITREELNLRTSFYEDSGDYEEVKEIINEESTEEHEIELDIVVEGSEEYSQSTSVEFVSGCHVLVKKEKTVKIELIPAENFLIEENARSIEESSMVGHKSSTTLGTLLDMGFEYDKVQRAAGGDPDDVTTNISSRARRENITGSVELSDEFNDLSSKEVELFEIYVKTSLESSINEDDDEFIAPPKLYQVFMTENVVLSYQEVDEVPYVGTSPNPLMFWGTGMVDQTKSIQRARTGLLRQQFHYNDMAAHPRFEYVQENIKNPADLFNKQPGAGIAVSTIGAIQPIQLASYSGDMLGNMNILDSLRESGTGMSFTGQSMTADVLKAGASTISAEMVLTESQKVQKYIIKTLLESAIKPLIGKIYNLLRDNFNEWEITIEDETMSVNPNKWPRLREVTMKTPLGRTAKLEKAQTLLELYVQASNPQSDAYKMFNDEKRRQLLIDVYKYRDIPETEGYMLSNEEVSQNNQIMNTMQQMQNQLKQMQEQMQGLMQENQTLQQRATSYAERELAVSEYKAQTERMKADADAAYKADRNTLDETKANTEASYKADKQSLDEAKFEHTREDDLADNEREDAELSIEAANESLKRQYAQENGFKDVNGSL